MVVQRIGSVMTAQLPCPTADVMPACQHDAFRAFGLCVVFISVVRSFHSSISNPTLDKPSDLSISRQLFRPALPDSCPATASVYGVCIHFIVGQMPSLPELTHQQWQEHYRLQMEEKAIQVRLKVNEAKALADLPPSRLAQEIVDLRTKLRAEQKDSDIAIARLTRAGAGNVSSDSILFFVGSMISGFVSGILLSKLWH
jgi:hypothetical protein